MIDGVNSQGVEWMLIRGRLDANLTKMRADLETPGLTQDRTEHLRGGIMALTLLISDVETPPEPRVEAVNYGT